jgi:hypothetical protein
MAMRVPWREHLSEESGYTLVETVVAMALFLSVLIPLGVAIGTLLLHREGEKLTQALLLAETEMTSAVLDSSAHSGQCAAAGGFIVRREVTVGRDTRDIQILILRQKPPSRALITLHKTLAQVR